MCSRPIRGEVFVGPMVAHEPLVVSMFVLVESRYKPVIHSQKYKPINRFEYPSIFLEAKYQGEMRISEYDNYPNL